MTDQLSLLPPERAYRCDGCGAKERFAASPFFPLPAGWAYFSRVRASGRPLVGGEQPPRLYCSACKDQVSSAVPAEVKRFIEENFG